YAVRQAISPNIVAGSDEDTNVFVPCGWRGPYVQLSSGLPSIYDGWGKIIANPNPLGAYTPSLYTFLGADLQGANYPTGYKAAVTTNDFIAGIKVEGPIYREIPLTSNLETDNVQ